MFTRQDKVQLGKKQYKNHNLKIKIPSEAGSKQLHHSTAPRHSKNSLGDLTRLVATEHVGKNIHSESQYTQNQLRCL